MFGFFLFLSMDVSASYNPYLNNFCLVLGYGILLFCPSSRQCLLTNWFMLFLSKK